MWRIWSYNDDSTDENWAEGTYNFFYSEATERTGYRTGFTQDIEITAYINESDSATALIAATTTATVLLTLM